MSQRERSSDAPAEAKRHAATPQGPTQSTEPKKGEPVRVPIPTREEFLRNLEKVAPPPAREN